MRCRPARGDRRTGPRRIGAAELEGRAAGDAIGTLQDRSPRRRLRPVPLPRRSAARYRAAMAKKKKRYLTATMADGYVKTIGPTAAPFTHYWRIVAHLNDGKTEVFWGHAASVREAVSKKALTE